MLYGYIYILENLINGKCYVGQTTDLSKRMSSHFTGKSQCPALQAAVRKYGREQFDFVLLEGCSCQEELNNQEKYWIDQLKTLSPFGYNLKDGGDQGGSPSSETREKIRQSLLGFKHTEEFKRKRSEAYKGEGHPLYGTHCSEETKRRISEAQKGINHWNYGGTIPEEQKEKMRQSKLGKNNPNFGKHLSEETKQKLRIASTGRKHSDATKLKMSKASKGRSLSEASRKKISISKLGMMSGKKNPMFGRTRTPEEKEKIREGLRKYREGKKLNGD